MWRRNFGTSLRTCLWMRDDKHTQRMRSSNGIPFTPVSSSNNFRGRGFGPSASDRPTVRSRLALALGSPGNGSARTPSTTKSFAAGRRPNRPLPGGRASSSCYDLGVSTLLQEAIERAQALPEDEQERLGALFLAEVEQAVREAEFDALIESRPDFLERLAAKVEAEIEAGLTEPLDLRTL